MTEPRTASPQPAPADLGDAAVALARQWLDAAGAEQPDAAAQRLAGVLKDPDGLDFTLGFVDGVARPEDLFVAGRSLSGLAAHTPRFLPAPLRAAVSAGGAMGEVVPGVVVPIARKVLREMVGHLVVDARPAKLGPAIAKLRERPDGGSVRLNVNLLGEAVLGEQEAARRLTGITRLVQRPDIDYVSVKVSSIAAGLSMWAFDETVERVVHTLTPLYRVASRKGIVESPEGAAGRTFLNLDMEEYRDLDLTLAVFQKLLDQEELLDVEAGVVLQAYLPDSFDALQRLQAWAAARRARGGAPVKVRVVKGANLAMERVDAALHGWPPAPYGEKVETDANYKRMLEWALRPGHTDALRIGVAGHNLFDLAWAWLLAESRGVTEAIDVEMLLGMATAQAEAVRATVGSLLLYTPVVAPAEFDVAIGYLVRRLEENSSAENFMSSLFDIGVDPAVFAKERDRFLASLELFADTDDEPGPPHRTQNRLTDDLVRVSGEFHNTPDTDPSLAGNREWGRRILARVAAAGEEHDLGEDTLRASRVDDVQRLDEVLARAVVAGREWGERSAEERAGYVRRAGYALEADRDRLVEVMVAETGKTLDQADPEVSEAVDFAHYYAQSALELDRVDGARFVPVAVTLVAPPWNFPVAIPAGSILAALAAGSAVVVKPAPQSRRSAAVLVEALWASGVPREVLTLVDVEEGELSRALVVDERVERVLLTGSYETAELFRSWRPSLALHAETSGKNAIVVTPSADLDLAVADIVASAFGHAGQKCSAASLVILVGSVARSKRFRRQLVDAVRSLRVGPASDPLSQVGPLVEPAEGKLLEALTTLGGGESWLVEPKKLDPEGQTWSPGLKQGVLPGSAFHLTEYFGPVLGIMHVSTLEKAIEQQNAVEFGLTAGLHSLDPEEIERWIAGVEAGNLYVNRGITGAIVRRQPFGGWKRSVVGPGAKAGGPNHLIRLGSWENEPGESSDGLSLAGLDPRVVALLEASTAGLEWSDFDAARRGAKSDEAVWRTAYAAADPSALGVEADVLRYRAVPVAIRLAEGRPLHELVRVLAAATLARSAVSVSSALKLPKPLRLHLKERGITVVIENDEAWLRRVDALVGSGRGDAAAGVDAQGGVGRVRSIGGDAAALSEALHGRCDVAVYAGEATRSGRIELLPFLVEQSVSVTDHRFGTPTGLGARLFPTVYGG
ncbi:bifunctional proline dehydrogenase/L-glutamate gamma-semialdehyde dehydrogenase [Herbiconiux moechotypicola]|uniref:L-glutamate gamma-semialdehyde dehydrogenase n=1 Tax=Herbiconiux moechotypicola TaxID=637393 RepID=A0ABP5Q5P3_9MICO|nr:bifunctional proline dehydrogenase/L-glutamate gamma-semialdehyde dehydrogenase [Herbiconiux moechotypicola]MCS5728831.1 bifunctional proline dehydrogenase/L-glutamate gamma-semialdehyde dehydrogenase [Herbiconiux moechotypicola]